MNPFLTGILPLPLAFLLDLLLGDPRRLYHPVRLIGRLIAWMELRLRAAFPPDEQGERAAGLVLAAAVPALALFIIGAILFAAARLHPLFRLLLETLIGYTLLAARSLQRESEAVCRALEEGTLDDARDAVSRIVGRNTARLSREQVVRAAVETVAENTSDGVVAPMLYMALGGAALGYFYKAVNTLDSMVGYKNERYLHFGRASAKLDDLLNYIPARLSAFCMVAAAACTGLDPSGAWRIWRRDRRRHASPNSAQTESACAGALHIQLAGDAVYFGRVVRKPAIGDDLRPPQPEDIRRAGRLMLWTSALSLLLLTALRGAVIALLLSWQ